MKSVVLVFDHDVHRHTSNKSLVFSSTYINLFLWSSILLVFTKHCVVCMHITRPESRLVVSRLFGSRFDRLRSVYLPTEFFLMLRYILNTMNYLCVESAFPSRHGYGSMRELCGRSTVLLLLQCFFSFQLLFTFNPFITGNTLLCGWGFWHAKHITMHVALRKYLFEIWSECFRITRQS